MLFNSLAFPYFFIWVTVLYFALPHRYRCALLLASSYYFYMCWNLKYVLLLAFTSGLDFFVARGIERASDSRVKRGLLLVSLASNLGVLVVFKYFNFFADSISASLSHFGMSISPVTLQFLLPPGISFYTFQSIAYTVDVYRGKIPAEKGFGLFMSCIAFFPQLVAGPIERGGHILPQFKREHHFNAERAFSGLRLALWGYFKKLVVADRLAAFVAPVYSHPTQFDPGTLLLATFYFAFQIYGDFSGYSDIARGTARILGFDLMVNFRNPYFARSIQEFWQRWHISLSTWFRDYLYVPLGGNRAGTPRTLLNIAIVFLLSGLWHGANWTFVLWGAAHGIMMIATVLYQRLSQPGTKRASSPDFEWTDLPRIGLTFFLVCITWVFFRAQNASDAFFILKSISSTGFSLTGSFALREFSGFIRWDHPVAWLAIIIMLTVEGWHAGWNIVRSLELAPTMVRYGIYYATILAVLGFGIFTSSSFIYFQF